MLKEGIRAGILPLYARGRPCLLPKESRCGSRDPRPSTAGRRAQTQTTWTSIKPAGPTLLDRSSPLLVPLGLCSRRRRARDCHRLASRRLPLVLALAIPSSRRSAEDHRGDSRARPPDGRRECRLGRTEDPRRTSKARFRGLGTKRASVSPLDPSPRESG